MWQAILGIADKVLGHFTPEQNKIRKKNKIDKLRREQKRLANAEPTRKNILAYERNDRMLKRLRQELIND